jgi:hypothetical protein
MPNFMLLLYDNPSEWAKLSPEEMQGALHKYMEWGKHTFIRGGQRLAEEPGKVLRSQPGQAPRVTDGPYSETKEVLGGFYVIEAADYAEATALSMDHPHLLYGGSIEVRRHWGE